MLPLLAGLVPSKWLVYGAVALSVLVGALVWLHSHDTAVRAEMQARADKVIAAQVEQDRQHEVAALQQAAADAEARLRALSDLKARTHSVPSTSACAGSPAVRALIDGLRQPTNGPGATR